MAWRETERSRGAMIRRTYGCSDCGLEWIVNHLRADDPVPDCPTCAMLAERVLKPIAVLSPGTKMTDAIARNFADDHGLSDIRTNQRDGDIAAVGPDPMQTAEREAISRQMVEAGLPPVLTPEQEKMAGGFWGSGQVQPTGVPAVDAVLANAVQTSPMAAAEARRLGADPVGLMHEAGRQGMLGMRLHVEAAANMDGDIKAAPKRPVAA